jgi:CRP-like cAMP-binding protein
MVLDGGLYQETAYACEANTQLLVLSKARSRQPPLPSRLAAVTKYSTRVQRRRVTAHVPARSRRLLSSHRSVPISFSPTQEHYEAIVHGTVIEPLLPTFELLRSLSAFAACPAPTLASLCLFSSRHTYVPGAVVVRQGERPDVLVVVEAGQCKLIRAANVKLTAPQGGSALDAKYVTYHTEIALVGESAVLCEDCALHKQPAADTVVATMSTSVVKVAGAELRRQLLMRAQRGQTAERLTAAAAAERTWREHRHQLLLSQRISCTDQLTPRSKAEAEQAHRAFDQAWVGGAAAINTDHTRRHAAPASGLQWGGVDLQSLQAGFQPPPDTSRGTCRAGKSHDTLGRHVM